MRVYLDDMRTTPDGWTRAYWPNEVIELLKSGKVKEISLDHDLGDAQGRVMGNERTGYDVLLWIEEKVFTEGFNPPKIKIHTANISARKKMKSAVDNIKRLNRRKQ